MVSQLCFYLFCSSTYCPTSQLRLFPVARLSFMSCILANRVSWANPPQHLSWGVRREIYVNMVVENGQILVYYFFNSKVKQVPSLHYKTLKTQVSLRRATAFYRDDNCLEASNKAWFGPVQLVSLTQHQPVLMVVTVTAPFVISSSQPRNLAASLKVWFVPPGASNALEVLLVPGCRCTEL